MSTFNTTSNFHRNLRSLTEASTIVPVGLTLKQYRCNGKLSQREIGERLGYFNINFLSMVEKGRTGIPANRFIDFMEAYEVPQASRFDLYARCYPVHWEALQKLAA